MKLAEAKKNKKNLTSFISSSIETYIIISMVCFYMRYVLRHPR